MSAGDHLNGLGRAAELASAARAPALVGANFHATPLYSLRLSRDKRYAAAGNNSDDTATPPSAESIAKMTHDRVVTMQGLEGIRIAELGHMVSAAYATKIMADLGADVVKVEEPTGDVARMRGPFPAGIADPEKSGLFLYLNTNKRGVTLDLPTRDRPQLERLVAWADILIHNYPPRGMAERGLDYERFRALNPRLVMCSITPFGLTGPHRDYNAYEITTVHGGGWAWCRRAPRIIPTFRRSRRRATNRTFTGA